MTSSAYYRAWLVLVSACSISLVYGFCGEAVVSSSCELFLSIPRAEWKSDERVVASLTLRNKGTSAVTVVRSWLPTGWEITGKYIQGDQLQENTLVGGALRGVSGEHYGAAKQPQDLVTLAPGEDIKTQVDLTAWLRNGHEQILEGEYRIVLRYQYERSTEDIDPTLFDRAVISNSIELRVKSKIP